MPTSPHIGPQQRALLEALRDGEELYRTGAGRWRLWSLREGWRSVNRERASSLYVRGFIYCDGKEIADQGVHLSRYTLTEQGKRAIEGGDAL